MNDGMKWTDYLPSDVLHRLGECRNVKKDLPILVGARYRWMKTQDKYKGFTREDALVYILELLDWNSQWELADLTVVEYNALCS